MSWFCWYVRIWRNNVGEQQRSHFGNNVGQSNDFCLQATSPHEMQQVVLNILQKKAQRFWGGKSVKKTSGYKVPIWNFCRSIIVVNFIFSKQAYFWYFSIINTYYLFSVLPAPQAWPSLLPWYRESFPS